MTPVPDSDLVRRARNGSREAFSELVQRHRSIVLSSITPLCRGPGNAEDVVQEASLRAFQGLASLSQPGFFRSWFVGIAKNVATDSYRAFARQQKHLSSLPQREPSYRALESPFDGEALRLALRSLDSEADRVLRLRYSENLTYRQISEATGLSLASVRGLLCRTIIALRHRLRRDS